jgi:hypothetical protein
MGFCHNGLSRKRAIGHNPLLRMYASLAWEGRKEEKGKVRQNGW